MAFVKSALHQIRAVIGATMIDPKLLTAAERLQQEGYLRRDEANAVILRAALRSSRSCVGLAVAGSWYGR